MPCNEPTDAAIRAYEAGLSSRHAPQTRHFETSVVPLLCRACWILESHGLVPAELRNWWDQHKVEDAARRLLFPDPPDRQAYLRSVKDRLMVQLTDDEKEALNLLEV